MFFAYDAAFTGSGAAETVGERRERKAHLLREEATRSSFNLSASGPAPGSIFKYPSFGFSRKPSPHSSRGNAEIPPPLLPKGSSGSSPLSSSLLSSTSSSPTTLLSPLASTALAPPTPPYSPPARRPRLPSITRFEPTIARTACEAGHSTHVTPAQASGSCPPPPVYSVRSPSPPFLGLDVPATKRLPRLHIRHQHQSESPQRCVYCRVRWDELELMLVQVVLVVHGTVRPSGRAETAKTPTARAMFSNCSPLPESPPTSATAAVVSDAGKNSTVGQWGRRPHGPSENRRAEMVPAYFTASPCRRFRRRMYRLVQQRGRWRRRRGGPSGAKRQSLRSSWPSPRWKTRRSRSWSSGSTRTGLSGAAPRGSAKPF